jgi:hypothetical protein
LVCTAELDRFWLEFSNVIPALEGAKQGTERAPVLDICRKAGISQATYFTSTGISKTLCCLPRCGG